MATAIIGKDHYHTELHTSTHALIADEPNEAGGKDEGPAPHEYLHMALAACTAITLRMYSDRKQWTVEKIRVEVTSEKAGNSTVFSRQVFVEGEVTEEQRTRLLQIANACPVHKTLTNPIEINTQLH
ncbi:MAG: putative redox protein, regulator of disulfide bond formation [Cytophagales bacterium]|jgi:putative redox protein|nr:OsmC family protein [Bacteroidota bacterium]MBS1981144.1 OsmC family protein [Bacteroidota bacterium]WHZ06620.1 MAG: putative redox protein, regulator of disulfide bond formation [Cytophagales bacterium]